MPRRSFEAWKKHLYEDAKGREIEMSKVGNLDAWKAEDSVVHSLEVLTKCHLSFAAICDARLRILVANLAQVIAMSVRVR